MDEQKNRTRHSLAELSPAGCLALMWNTSASELVKNEKRQKLWRIASTLPPIPRIALEVRLGASDEKVDMHQMITAGDDDPAILAKALALGPTKMLADNILTAFLRCWACNDNHLRNDFDRLFLEWDMPLNLNQIRVPAVFLAVDLSHDEPEARSLRKEKIRLAIAQLQIGRCIPDCFFDAARNGIVIGHIGIMLGRSNAIRLNYHGVQPSALPDLLRELYWPGKISQAVEYFNALVELTDSVTVGLDLGDTLLPSLGFELFFKHEINESARWTALLDHLITLGVCSPQKQQALSSARALLTPVTPGQVWPASWVLETARIQPNSSPCVAIGVSHLKLSLDEHGRTAAKAYLTAEHHWSDPARLLRSPARLRKSASLQESVERVVRFLVTKRQQNGMWTDYNSYNGGCGTYVSAHVAASLLVSRIEEGVRCALAAVPSFLRRRRPDGGWGHQEQAPSDSDTTAAVLKFFLSLGDATELIETARPFLLSHCLADGGFTSYSSVTPISFARGATNDKGWRSSHLCVAANCALFLPQRIQPLLRSTQNADGSWLPYWWRSAAYATVLAAETLALFGEREAVLRAVTWAVDHDAETAFEQFCRIRLLLLGNDEHVEQASRIMAEMLKCQYANGSWGLGADMVVPMPEHESISADALPLPEDEGVFTAAIALATIVSFKNHSVVSGRLEQ